MLKIFPNKKQTDIGYPSVFLCVLNILKYYNLNGRQFISYVLMKDNLIFKSYS